MSNTNQQARNFLSKAIKPESQFKEGFEVSGLIKAPTIAIPISIELSEEEKRSIEKMMSYDYHQTTIAEDQVVKDIEQLKSITKQIKSISAQNVLLHGERIQQAQRLLSNYRDGAFSHWLMETYGNRQTPYSMLRYYEFYQSAPKDTQVLIESAPKKAVYLLASRNVDDTRKLDFIREYGTYTQNDLVTLIQETFPTKQPSSRISKKKSEIQAMDDLCSKLEKRTISNEERIHLKKIIQRLDKL